MTEIEIILSRIKSIGYFLAHDKNHTQNKGFLKQIEGREKKAKSDMIDLKLFDLNKNLKALSNHLKVTTMSGIRKIKICVASSHKFHTEREAIASYLFQKNDELVETGIYLSYNVWEKQSMRFNHTYKQEDFNKALVYESEIFICLIGEDVGKFTKEEFDEAYARFKAKEKPFVMTVFFKEFTNEEIGEQATNNLEGWTRRVALQKYIQNDLQQFYGSFKNPDDIINQIDKTIAEDISIVKSVAP